MSTGKPLTNSVRTCRKEMWWIFLSFRRRWETRKRSNAQPPPSSLLLNYRWIWWTSTNRKPLYFWRNRREKWLSAEHREWVTGPRFWKVRPGSTLQVQTWECGYVPFLKGFSPQCCHTMISFEVQGKNIHLIKWSKEFEEQNELCRNVRFLRSRIFSWQLHLQKCIRCCQ